MECTTIKERTTLRKRTIERKKQALIRGLIYPGGCRWESELSPKALLLFGYKGRTTELLSQPLAE